MPHAFPGAKRKEPSIDARKLDAIREHVVMHFPKLETTLDQALDIALDLEELELDNIYRRLLALTSDDSRMSSGFRTALGQYSHHEERLLAAIEKHSKIPHSSSALQRPAAACSAAGEDPATTQCDPRRGGGLRGDPTARGVIRSQPQSLCLTESASSEWRSQYRRTPCVLTRKDVLKSVGIRQPTRASQRVRPALPNMPQVC